MLGSEFDKNSSCHKPYPDVKNCYEQRLPPIVIGVILEWNILGYCLELNYPRALFARTIYDQLPKLFRF